MKAKKETVQNKQLKVTLNKSTTGHVKSVKDTIAALGLKKINSSKILPVNPAVLGMIDKVKFMITVEDIK